MRTLLDTHAFIWFAEDRASLSRLARETLENARTQPVLSVVTPFEMAIKISISKMTLTRPLAEFLPFFLEENSIALLDIRIEHAVRLITLPLDHREPFDRMIAAQALVEDIPVISADPKLGLFGVIRIW